MHTTTVTDLDGHKTEFDISGNAGSALEGFHSKPLLETTVDVGGKDKSCLIAQFSFHKLISDVGDQFAVFQVNVDGQPMLGHTTWCHLEGRNFPCIVFDGSAEISGHSYHLLLRDVPPGSHEVEVRFDGYGGL